MLPRCAVLGCVAVLAAGCSAPRGEQLCEAIAKRDLAAVRRVLAGPPLDMTRPYGSCVPADVIRLAKANDRVLTDLGIELLSAGLPADASWTPPGRAERVSAIEVAARNGNDELVRGLLAVGLPVTSLEVTRAFVLAAGDGHLAVVRQLVQDGADLEATAGGETALDRARANNRTDVVRYLEATLAARAAAAAAAASQQPAAPQDH